MLAIEIYQLQQEIFDLRLALKTTTEKFRKAISIRDYAASAALDVKVMRLTDELIHKHKQFEAAILNRIASK